MQLRISALMTPAELLEQATKAIDKDTTLEIPHEIRKQYGPIMDQIAKRSHVSEEGIVSALTMLSQLERILRRKEEQSVKN